MAKIVINDELEINGRLTVQRTRVSDEKGNLTSVVSGVLATHLYIEIIDKIETGRLILKGVDVKKENFGSDDYDVVYEFTASELINKGTKYKDNYYFDIDGETLKLIEDKLYPYTDPVLGSIEDEDLFKQITDIRDKKELKEKENKE